MNKQLKKLKHKKIVLFLVLLVGLSLVGLLFFLSRNKNDNKNIEFKPKAEEGAVTPPSVETQVSGGDKSTQPLVKESNNIQIVSPKTGTKIADGSEVSGQVGDKLGTLGYKIKGMKSGVLVDYPARLEVTSKNQSFKFEIGLEKEPVQGDVGSLEVYIMKDGQKVDFASIEVAF